MDKEKREQDLQRVASVLVQLDEKSLLLIDSGAKLLLVRQEMAEKEVKAG